MGEKGYNPEQNRRPTVKMSFAEYEKLLAQQETATPRPQAAAPRQAPPRPQQPYQEQAAPRPQSSRPSQSHSPRPERPASSNAQRPAPETSVSIPNKKRGFELHLPKSKAGRIGLVAVLAVSLTGGAYGLNVGNVQDMVSSIGSDNGSQPNTNIEITQNETLGQKTLAPDQCNDPAAALMVVEVSGYFPLVPQLADANHPTAVDIPPYMTTANENKLPSDQQDEFSKFVTKSDSKKESGYPQVEVKDLPLAIHVCEPAENTAILDSVNPFTIHRPALTSQIADIWDEYSSDVPVTSKKYVANMPSIGASLQMSGADDGDTNPGKGIFMTMPNPAYNLFLGNGKDDVQNKSIAALQAGIKTEAQQKQLVQVVLATIEASVAKELDDAVNPPQNIDGMTSFQNALDNALAQRAVGKSADDLKKAKAFNGDGNYSTPVKNLPLDPTTHKPIVFPNLDLNQDFVITSGKVTQGSIKKPTFAAPAPTPTPSVTPTPTK